MGTDSIPDFQRLGQGVWLYDPPVAGTPNVSPTSTTSTTTTTTTASPINLIILTTWMGAAPKHIAKYTSQHQLLFPTAQILLLQSTPLDVAWHSDAHQAQRLAPAIAVMNAFVERQETSPPGQQGALCGGVLLHLFSNGGAVTACRLAVQLRAESGRTLPLTAVVLDSSPGGATLQRVVAAFAASLPKGGVIRFLGVLVLYVVYAALVGTLWVLGRDNKLDRMRKQLNDGALFDRAAPRVYCYSKRDRLVDWEDVEAHAAGASAAGFDVRRDVFEGSEHVAHALVERERYWGVVQRICQ